MDGFGKMLCEPPDTCAPEDFRPAAAFQWAVLAEEAMSQGHSERAEELIELAYSASGEQQPELQRLMLSHATDSIFSS